MMDAENEYRRAYPRMELSVEAFSFPKAKKKKKRKEKKTENRPKQRRKVTVRRNADASANLLSHGIVKDQELLIF